MITAFKLSVLECKKEAKILYNNKKQIEREQKSLFKWKIGKETKSI